MHDVVKVQRREWLTLPSWVKEDFAENIILTVSLEDDEAIVKVEKTE